MLGTQQPLLGSQRSSLGGQQSLLDTQQSSLDGQRSLIAWLQAGREGSRKRVGCAVRTMDALHGAHSAPYAPGAVLLLS
ncbi:MAG TPA: hypothetical protein VF173_05905, partial [Thermoanaerobaculia bacterium]|nr:hypothetical protein [Thermoanaerobaculia bacterium]